MPVRSKEELDKEWIELLNELRVVLPGVQVLFAFLLAAPFSPLFGSVTDVQKNAYFLSLLFTTISAGLMTPPPLSIACAGATATRKRCWRS